MNVTWWPCQKKPRPVAVPTTPDPTMKKRKNEPHAVLPLQLMTCGLGQLRPDSSALKLESAADSGAQMPDPAIAYIEICTSLIAR
jgi:hypothetical protein